MFIKTLTTTTTIAAFALAAPLCFIAMIKWMESFAYRKEIKVSWFGFVLLIIVGLIAIISTSQTIQAANLNSTKVLKD